MNIFYYNCICSQNIWRWRKTNRYQLWSSGIASEILNNKTTNRISMNFKFHIYIYIFYRTTLHRSPSFYKFNLHADQSSGSNRHERHFNFHSLRATTNTPPFFIKFHLHTQRQITRAIRQICISKHYPNSISLDHQRTPFSNSIARSEWIFCLEAKRQRKFNQRYLIPVSNIVTKFYTSPFSYAIYI